MFGEDNSMVNFTILEPSLAADSALRQLEPEWNMAMIAASIGISFLGAFTSTQLMCHARMSIHFRSVLLWSVLGSMIFGFCSVWCLHEVAMLGLNFDVRIEVSLPLTILSSILAVLFTFLALSSDLLYKRYSDAPHKRHRRQQRLSHRRRPRDASISTKIVGDTQSAAPLLQFHESEDEEYEEAELVSNLPTSESMPNHDQSSSYVLSSTYRSPSASSSASSKHTAPHPGTFTYHDDEEATAGSVGDSNGSQTRTSASDYFSFRRSSTSSGSLGLGSAVGIVLKRSTLPVKNVFITTATLLHAGLTCKNLGKGFAWSLAISGMHYVGIFALQVPSGFLSFNIWFVLLSALLSWTVCTLGCILMTEIETHLPQQILFSVMAATGVAAMHFTGMHATTFYSTAPPSDVSGYPPALANAVVGIAFVTCIAANVLLAHSATVSRMKLAEIVTTRKALWKTIALKETAEAAARARSDFIASASHEIRTPLHHLQGYSDLLAHTELTEEGRTLLTSIQRATKTLSLSKSNFTKCVWLDRN
jgi:NO-binding membrane sensor protein with MHYT domain